MQNVPAAQARNTGLAAGKMRFAIAAQARRRGIAVSSQLPPPKGGVFKFGCKPTKVIQLLNPSPQPSPARGEEV